MDLSKMTACMAAEAVRSKELTARRLAEACIDRCKAVNGTLNSLITVLEESALKQADAVVQKVRGEEGALPLAGVPLAVKDDFCLRDNPTTCGSAGLKDFRPPCSAAAVDRLMEAGTVVTGKANLDEFGLGSSTAGSFFGPTANPWDPSKTAGDGGAAAVAAGQCLLALSSDSGGSLGIGASYCGLFGLLPTAGLVSRCGLITCAPSFARAGVIARSAGDALAALKVIAGFDPRDSSTAATREGFKNFGLMDAPEGIKCGWPETVFGMLDQETGSALEAARQEYTAAGVEFIDISLPHFKEALQAYYVIAAAEAFSNLARFDGIRFGISGQEDDLEGWYSKIRAASFGVEGKRRSVFGSLLLTGENFDRYYSRARKVWALVKQDFGDALERCDLVMLPAADVPGELTSGVSDFINRYSEDRFCAPGSLAGLPVLTVPAGRCGSLPVGLQLVGRPFSEGMLVNLAAGVAGDADLPSPEARY